MTESKSITASFKNLKWWQATIMIVLILTASGFAAWGGANVSVNIDLQTRLAQLEDQINIPVNSTVSAMAKTASYIISSHDVGGTTYYCMINGTDDRAGRLEFYSTNASAVINAALGNSSDYGVIYLKEPMKIWGELIIRKPISIIHSGRPCGAYYAEVFIRKITISADTGNVVDVYLEGLTTNQLSFVVTGTNILSGITCRDCRIYQQNNVNDKGIIFDVPSGAGGVPCITNIRFLHCDFLQQGVPAGYGFITIVKGGFGQLRIQDCTFYQSAVTGSFILIKDYGNASICPALSDVAIDNLCIAISGGGNLTLIKYENNRFVGIAGLYGIKIKGGYWETHGAFTMLKIDTINTQPIAVDVIVEGVTFDPTAGTTTTILNNSNTNWQTNWHNHVILSDCEKINTGTLVAGTWNVGANFHVTMDVEGYTFSENSVAVTNTTATTFVFNHGLYSTATYVWCSFNFTGWTSWTWTSTTTQATVTVTGTLPAAMTCYAKVEYVP